MSLASLICIEPTVIRGTGCRDTRAHKKKHALSSIGVGDGDDANIKGATTSSHSLPPSPFLLSRLLVGYKESFNCWYYYRGILRISSHPLLVSWGEVIHHSSYAHTYSPAFHPSLTCFCPLQRVVLITIPEPDLLLLLPG